jgi:hypothetical protein
MTTTQIFESKESNKSELYMNEVRSLAKKANELENNTDSFFTKMSCKEVLLAMRRAESANCEYTLYISCNEAEKWLEKAIEKHYKN